MKKADNKVRVMLIGSGRVATHMAQRLTDNGISVSLVVSRTLENAQKLAQKLGAKASSQIPQNLDLFDFIIISVSDDAYEYYISQLKSVQKSIIVHTSGSININLFQSQIPNYGVLYPFQTFSFDREVDFSLIPIMIEANNEYVLNKIRKLAFALSPNVMEIDSQQRAIIHIAAVFVCNFVNHLYVEAESLLKTQNIDFSILHSLMRETTEKAIKMSPIKAQTGPASRNDQKIINQHQKLISDEKTRELYIKISQLIVENRI